MQALGRNLIIGSRACNLASAFFNDSDIYASRLERCRKQHKHPRLHTFRNSRSCYIHILVTSLGSDIRSTGGHLKVLRIPPFTYALTLVRIKFYEQIATVVWKYTGRGKYVIRI